MAGGRGNSGTRRAVSNAISINFSSPRPRHPRLTTCTLEALPTACVWDPVRGKRSRTRSCYRERVLIYGVLQRGLLPFIRA